jgi:hypothetical protein
LEQLQLKEQENIIEDMAYSTSRLKEGALMIQHIVRSDAKKIDHIEKTSEKQTARMEIEKHALKRYYQSTGPRTCKELTIVMSILVVFFATVLLIAFTDKYNDET